MAATKAIVWAWLGYSNNALGWDKLVFTPFASGGDDGMHMAATAIDSLDTLILANVDYSDALPFVRSARVDTSRHTNFFEATIRILGGLLSAHALTEDDVYKSAAVRVGDELVKAFDLLPCATLYHGECVKESSVSIAVAGSNILEFTQLSRITGNKTYRAAAEHAFGALIQSAKANSNMLISHVDFRAKPLHGRFSYGGESDSFWEYLLKSWILGGCMKIEAREVFNGAVSNFISQDVMPKGHLDCFFPGLLALSYLYNGPTYHLAFALRSMSTCLSLYKTPTGLGAEDTFKLGYTKLRPEVMESLYMLWFVTGENTYRLEAEKIMKAINKYAKRPLGGYCGVSLRDGKCPRWQSGEYQDAGSMPSFFIAETLKYFLLFSVQDVSPLTHVFTTEAHLMPLTKGECSTRI